jgi:hypothetical protein
MTLDNYNAQKAAYNLTIQHTVADAMDGVTPERVTNILVTPTATGSAHRGLFSISTAAASVEAVFLAYTVEVHDPTLSFDELKAQLIEAASSGAMDEDLHNYAAVYGAENLANGTFSAPTVQQVRAQRSSSSKLTGAQITGLVIGIVLCLVLLATAVAFCLAARKRNDERDPHKHEAVPQVENDQRAEDHCIVVALEEGEVPLESAADGPEAA